MNRGCVVGDVSVAGVRKSPAMWTRQYCRSLLAWAILIESRSWVHLAFQKTLGVPFVHCLCVGGRWWGDVGLGHVGERDVGPLWK
jgi:hypothetical protein